MPDIEVARNFVKALTGDPSSVIRFRTVHDKDRKRAGMDYEGTVDEHWADLCAAQANGYGVFYFMSEIAPGPGQGNGGTATDEDVTATRVIGMDCDDGLPEPWELHAAPDIITHTSPGRGQILWRIKLPVEQFRHMQRRLAAMYGTDCCVVNPSRVFRLPGTLHQKREPTLVTFELGAGCADPTVGLPQIVAQVASHAAGQPVTLEHLTELLKHVPPDVSYPDWRDRVAAIRNTNAGTEEERYDLARDWSRTGDLDPDDRFDRVWETMPPKTGGVGYGTLFHVACAHGYTGGSDVQRLPSDRFGAASYPEPEGSYPSPKTGTDLLAGSFPRASFAIDKLILRAHVNLLYGDGGAGKTLLTEHMAVALAAGLPLLGFHTIQMPTLLVLAEDDWGETRARLEEICRKFKVKLDDIPLLTWCLPHLDVTLATVDDNGGWEPGPFLPVLEKELRKLPSGLVVLDTVSDIARLDENKRQSVNTLCKVVLGGLCSRHDVTVVVNAHPSKAAMESGAGYAGSTAWNNAVRHRLLLTKDKEDHERRTLSVAKTNYGEEISIPLLLTGATFDTLKGGMDTVAEALYRKVCVDIAILLAEQGTPYTLRGTKLFPWAIKIIADRTGRRHNERDFRAELAAANHEGQLRYVPAGTRGYYTGYHPPLTGDPHAAPANTPALS